MQPSLPGQLRTQPSLTGNVGCLFFEIVVVPDCSKVGVWTRFGGDVSGRRAYKSPAALRILDHCKEDVSSQPCNRLHAERQATSLEATRSRTRT